MDQTPELPPEPEDMNSAQPDESNDAEVSRPEYAEWWGRASELLRYLKKLPEKLTDKVDMTGRKEELVSAFDQLSSPDDVPVIVQEGTVKQLTSWIEKAESFIGFFLQSYEPAAPTTQAPILVTSIEEDGWQWPWIEGWEDPKKRKKILNPPKKSDSQMKRLLIGGAVIGSALYLGKRVMGED